MHNLSLSIYIITLSTHKSLLQNLSYLQLIKWKMSCNHLLSLANVPKTKKKINKIKENKSNGFCIRK